MKKEYLENFLNELLDESIIGDSLETGFHDLDETLFGNRVGSLIVIGGRPAMGKTTFMTSLAENLLKQNKSCLFLTLERTSQDMMEKILTQYCEIHYIEKHTDLFLDSSKDKLRSAIKDFEKYNLEIADNCFTPKNILEKISNSSCKNVFIDYLQLINFDENKVRQEEVNKFLFELKQLALEKNKFIFISSQISRALEKRSDKHPLLIDLKDSYSLEDIADVVLLIYREAYYNLENNWRDEGEIIVAKNKKGPTVSVSIGFNFSIPKFFSNANREESF